MKNQDYMAPEMTVVSVELENGIAQSAIPAGYGAPGAAGAAGSETGTTNW